MFKEKNTFSQIKKGFTLIELIVVMAIFLLVIGAAITIFISMIQSQRNILAEQSILNQVSYAEEYMSKALRVAKTATTDSDIACMTENGVVNAGYSYLLTRYDATTGLYDGIKFINQSDDNACEEFYLDTSDGTIKEIENGGAPVALTSVNLKINSVQFGINGEDGSDSGCANPPNQCGASEADLVQPRVTILMSVNLSNNTQVPATIIQTTVSQRNLNAK